MTVSIEPAHDHRVPSQELLSIARWYASRPDRWSVAPRFDPDRRWYHLISDDPHVQVWLLSWLPGQTTGLHDHGGSSGAFVVVQGTLREHTTTAHQPGDPAPLAELTVPTGVGRSFGPHYIHQVTNASSEPAVSLHVYGPALRQMTRYRVEDGRLHVTAVERAGVDW